MDNRLILLVKWFISSVVLHGKWLMMRACRHIKLKKRGEDYNLVWLIAPALSVNFESGRLKNLKARSEAGTKTNTRRTHFQKNGARAHWGKNLFNSLSATFDHVRLTVKDRLIITPQKSDISNSDLNTKSKRDAEWRRPHQTGVNHYSEGNPFAFISSQITAPLLRLTSKYTLLQTRQAGVPFYGADITAGSDHKVLLSQVVMPNEWTSIKRVCLTALINSINPLGGVYSKQFVRTEAR